MTALSQIQDLLTSLPDFQTTEERKALINYIGLTRLRRKIDWSGNTETFVNALLKVIAQEGRETFLELLTQLENWVGVDQQEKLASIYKDIIALTPEHWQAEFTEDRLSDETVNELFSATVRLVKLSEIIPATDEEIQQYYEGAPLTWKILMAQGDVERDLYEKLFKSLTPSINQTSMFCLCGEPGSGKSTLAWRLSAEVARSLKQPLLQVLDNEADIVWYKLQNALRQYQLSIVVLVDDIFRDYNVKRALASLGPDLNIIIIATSRSNELPDDLRLPFPLRIEELGAPTENEKKHVLEKLAEHSYPLGAIRYKHFQSANSWLSMMFEVTTGEELAKIVRNTVKHLKHQNEIVYRAYEYLCYAGQFDLAIPETLIAALDALGRFYDLPNHPNARGLIFHDSLAKDRLRTKHPTIAFEAWKCYRRDPQVIVREFIDVAQPSQKEHRNFIIHLLLRQLILYRQKPMVRNILEQQAEAVNAILRESSSGELLFNWIKLYRLLQDRMKIKELEKMILSKSPVTPIDWHAQFNLVERRGTPEQLAEVIAATTRWLAENPQDVSVRTTYLGLVERRGTPEQQAEVIAATTRWLAENPRDVSVRTTYLRLVERRGTPEQQAEVIAATTRWLAEESPRCISSNDLSEISRAQRHS